MDYAQLKTEVQKPQYAGLNGMALARAVKAATTTAHRDVTPGEVAGYFELNIWATADTPQVYIYEKLVTVSGGAGAAATIASKALRIFGGNSKITTIEMSKPGIYAKISALLDLFVSAGMDASNKAGILALADTIVPVVTTIGCSELLTMDNAAASREIETALAS